MINQHAFFKLIYPSWVKIVGNEFTNLIDETTILLTDNDKVRLDTVLNIDFLETPCNESEVLTRIWGLELMDKGFLIPSHGLVNSTKYPAILNDI
jgi:hypothetical protein